MDKWIMCVVALILGMLLANMLKNVCGCNVVEGQWSEDQISSSCLNNKLTGNLKDGVCQPGENHCGFDMCAFLLAQSPDNPQNEESYNDILDLYQNASDNESYKQLFNVTCPLQKDNTLLNSWGVDLGVSENYMGTLKDACNKVCSNDCRLNSSVS